MSDNTAILAGYTIEMHAGYGDYELFLLLPPETDVGQLFRAWDMDQQEFITIHGWKLSNIRYPEPPRTVQA